MEKRFIATDRLANFCRIQITLQRIIQRKSSLLHSISSFNTGVCVASKALAINQPYSKDVPIESPMLRKRAFQRLTSYTRRQIINTHLVYRSAQQPTGDEGTYLPNCQAKKLRNDNTVRQVLSLGRQIPIGIGITIPRQIDTYRYRYTQNHLIYVSARRFLFTFTRTLPKDLFIKRRLEIAFAEETSFKVNERIIIIISNRFNQIALKYLQPKAAAAAIFIASNRYLGSRRFASNT